MEKNKQIRRRIIAFRPSESRQKALGIRFASIADVRLVVGIFLLFATGLLEAKPDVSGGLELPIEFREGLLWVKVKVPQSAEPLNFLLDTGASASVLNLSTAKRLGLKLGNQVSVMGVNTTLTGHWPVRLSATANQIDLPRKYLALDLSKLSGACSNAVDGLLGADFFCDRVVQIDYAAQKLRLLDPKLHNAGYNAIPLEIRRCGLRVPISINGGKREWVRLDTGCATALQWVTTTVPSAQCTRKPAVGFTELSIPQTVTSVSLGASQVTDVPTGLHDQAIFPGESGLLGNGLLARFGVVTIHSTAGQLILGPVLSE